MVPQRKFTRALELVMLSNRRAKDLGCVGPAASLLQGISKTWVAEWGWARGMSQGFGGCTSSRHRVAKVWAVAARFALLLQIVVEPCQPVANRARIPATVSLCRSLGSCEAFP